MTAIRGSHFVGEIILQQIVAASPWALAAWGAFGRIGIWNEVRQMPNQEGEFFELGSRGGGVSFRVRGTNPGYGKAATVHIGLQWDDTYTVVGGRVHKGEWKTLDVVEGVYFDQLVDVIDGMVG